MYCTLRYFQTDYFYTGLFHVHIGTYIYTVVYLKAFFRPFLVIFLSKNVIVSLTVFHVRPNV